MPRPRNPIPSYCRNKRDNTARCWAGGRWVCLGAWNSPESKEAYQRVCAELLSGRSVLPKAAGSLGRNRGSPTVAEVLLAFARFADGHYRRADGTPTAEVREFASVIRATRELYGSTPAAEFGPLAMKAVREQMVANGWCRTTVNNRVRRLRKVFKWAVEEELVPPATWTALQAVAGLKRGRTSAREPKPVLPVAESVVNATLPHLSRTVRAIVLVQWHTGMRPGEVVKLRDANIDTSGEGGVWTFQLDDHKNTHRGKERIVVIGPQAQDVLRPFRPADPAAYYFDPRREVEQLHAERAAARKTPRYPSHMRANAAKRERSRGKAKARPPADRYTSHSYAVAVMRAVEKANERRERMAGPGNFDPVPHWTPNQLRHSFATRVRREFGLEAAQVLLGHAKADVTQVYAERDLAKAAEVAAKIG